MDGTQTYDYATGRRDAAEWIASGYAPWRLELDAQDAVREWRCASFDHGHVSYWGISHIREMVAYWLGVLRETRTRL